MKRRRPEFNKAFGQYLRRLRGPRTWGQIERWLRKHPEEVPEQLDSSKLSLDEQGKIRDIPADRLKTYSRLYEVPYEVLVSEWVKGKYGVDFSNTIEVQVRRNGRSTYSPETREWHDMFEWILTRGKKEEAAWILGNLKVFFDRVRSYAGFPDWLEKKRTKSGRKSRRSAAG